MLRSVISTVRRFASTVALAALAGFTSTSHAVVYVGNWDPQFNVDFSGVVGMNVGWRGTATINVDDACVPAFPFIPANVTVAFPNGCGTATLLSYGLEFYDTIPANILSAQGGAGPGLPDPDPGAVSFSFGVVSGMDLSAPVTLLQETFAGITYDVELDFNLTGPTLKLTYFSGGDGCPVVEGEPQCVFNSATEGPNAPIMNWRIPEPTSLALLGAALAGLGWTRRRRG